MSEWTYDQLVEHNIALCRALKPFARFAREEDFYLLPNDEPMTTSHANHNHVVAGDFKEAYRVLYGERG